MLNVLFARLTQLGEFLANQCVEVNGEYNLSKYVEKVTSEAVCTGAHALEDLGVSKPMAGLAVGLFATGYLIYKTNQKCARQGGGYENAEPYRKVVLSGIEQALGKKVAFVAYPLLYNRIADQIEAAVDVEFKKIVDTSGAISQQAQQAVRQMLVQQTIEARKPELEGEAAAEMATVPAQPTPSIMRYLSRG